MRALLFWRPLQTAAICAFLALLFAVIGLVYPRKYTATASFVPEQSPSARLATGLGAIAGQLGVPLGGDPATSPRFYADLVTSRSLLERLLEQQFGADSTHRTKGRSLTDILEIPGKPPPQRANRAVRALRKRIAADASLRTAVVSVTVTMPDGALAADVANAVLVQLNNFNSAQRQSSARRRREFLDEQMRQQALKIQSLEEELRSFLEANRLTREAPHLALREQRLHRQLDAEQEVYVALRRNFDQARLDEVNDAPVITVIDRPAIPTEADGFSNKIRLALALFLGVVVGSAVTIAINQLRAMRGYVAAERT